MAIVFDTRSSNSPYIASITQGYTTADGTALRPAETNWHLVMVQQHGETQLIVTGAWTEAGIVNFGGDAQILWIQFNVGTSLANFPISLMTNHETNLPQAAHSRFWINSAAWELPSFENAETFVDKLVRDETLIHDPVVHDALHNKTPDVSPRTLRHRFAKSTGMSQKHIEQVQRAKQAQALLRAGTPILDVTYQLGYYDQPHLTKSLKRYIGYTPAEIFTPTE